MRKKSRRILFPLLLLVYALLLIITFSGAVAPFLDVAVLGLVQFIPVGLAFLLPLHLLALLYFLRRSRLMALGALLAIACCLWVGTKDIRWQQPTPPIDEQHLSVVSFNVRSFQYHLTRVDSVVHLLKSLNPDIVCLQEFRNQSMGESLDTDQYLARELGMEHYRFVALPIHIHGAIIFSKYPILGIDTLYVSRNEVNSGFLATLNTPMGKVGVANLHMSSFGLESEMKKNPGWRERFRIIPARMETVLRRQQKRVDAVMEKTRTYPYPLIIAADMNSAPHTRITSQFATHLNDSFLEQGDGLGWTYPLLGPFMVRIDYLFSSSEFDVLSHNVIASGLSDHYPIQAKYRLQP